MQSHIQTFFLFIYICMRKNVKYLMSADVGVDVNDFNFVSRKRVNELDKEKERQLRILNASSITNTILKYKTSYLKNTIFK